MAIRELNIFVDESGDFSSFGVEDYFYIVSLVFHEPSNDITSIVKTLNDDFNFFKIPDFTAHASPIIRGAKEFYGKTIPQRQQIFNAFFRFIKKSPIRHKSIVVDKKIRKSQKHITVDIFDQLLSFLRDNLSYFQGFDVITIYYDNGQQDLGKILQTALNNAHSNVAFRKIKPFDYKLFQVADFICTLEFVRQKLACGVKLNNSEKSFFRSHSSLRNKYLQHIDRLNF